MQAEIAATPELVNLSPPLAERPAGSVEVEPALIGRILWRRRKPILLVAAFAGLAALGYSLLATPQYTATAEILVDPRDKQVVNNDVNPSAIAADGGVTQVESQGSVLQSSGVLLRAIAATHLEQDSEFNGAGLLGAVTNWLTKPDPDQMAERLKAETLQNLGKRITVKRAEKVLVLDLSVRARTAERAAELANAIADAYLADQADTRADSGREASKGLTARLGELQASVRDAETAVADYQANHGFVISSGQLVSDQEINQATAQLSGAQNRVASLKSQLDQLRRAPGSEGTPEAMASATMVRLRDRESAIVEQLANASGQLGPLHPQIASLRQSLADVRGLISREALRLRQAAQADYARARDDEQALAKKLDAMKTKSLEDDKADVHLRELQRQAEAARTIYQAFLVRARETMEASNLDTTNARIITRALPPLRKSWPPTLLLVLGAALMGLSLGASGALAHEYMRPSLYTPEQARALLGAPVIGVVSLRDLSEDGRAARTLVRLVLRGFDDGEAVNGASIGHCLYLASPRAAGRARALLAERIAAQAAESGQTLLIDGDLAAETAPERPGSVAGRSGLIDLLRGDETVTSLAYRNSGERFFRLARGEGDPFAPMRAGSDSFRLRRIRRCYDLVVIDGGAMSDNPRLSPLSAQADLVLLVALIGAPQADVAREAEAAIAAGARFNAIALIDPGGA
jgi:uncharacterized protein involved in exopolysaccharide biosynthesis/Mrp family chromosome partitioning ATPase